MGDLNNDWVLWGSIGALVFSIVALIAFGWKAARGMEGQDKKDEQTDK